MTEKKLRKMSNEQLCNYYNNVGKTDQEDLLSVFREFRRRDKKAYKTWIDDKACADPAKYFC